MSSSPNDPTRDYRGDENLDATESHHGTYNARPSGSPVPQYIGPYKLLHRLGAGGMGEVWVAEQFEPVKRRVALKLIKTGIGSKEIIARFDAERQALSLMNHPNIARILDAGTTREGQPYFVMELVAGKPLTNYCDDNRLSIDQRLKLFIDVCAGVQHAHQKGIIHRDLKPGNIIVGLQDGVAVPKIIDFGLAKAMENTQRLTDESLFTGIGQILGTLKYMSPEQASLDSLDIDTRTDIYALGVILYELLTGSTPLDDSSLKGQAALRILEYIREKEPVKPSSRLGSSTDQQLSSITGQRQTDSGRLKRILLGDLDWIVMKALDKDRTRRYESASGFAADVKRYLNSEPVIARPPSLQYKLRKFIKKNTIAVAAGSVILVVLIGGITGTTGMMLRAWKAETLSDSRLVTALAAQKQAEIAAQRELDARLAESQQRRFAETINRFVIDDFLALTSVEGQDRFGSDDFRGLDRNTTLLQLLERAASRLNARADLDPLIESELCWVVGVNLRAIGKFEESIGFLRRSYDLLQNLATTNPQEFSRSLNSLAVAYHAAGKLDHALPLYEDSLKRSIEDLGAEHEETLAAKHNLAGGLYTAGQTEKAKLLYHEVLERSKALHGDGHAMTLESQINLAQLLARTGNTADGLRLAENASALAESVWGVEDRLTLKAATILAEAAALANQSTRALELIEKNHARTVAKYGPDDPSTRRTMSVMATIYSEIGKFEEAKAILEALADSSCLPAEHHDSLSWRNNLAGIYFDTGNYLKAKEMYQGVLEVFAKQLGTTHPDTLTCLNNLAQSMLRAGEVNEALHLHEQVLDGREDHFGRDHPLTLMSCVNLGETLRQSGMYFRAFALLRRAKERFTATVGKEDVLTLTASNGLANCYAATRQYDKAIALYEENLQSLDRMPEPPVLLRSTTESSLAANYFEVGKLHEAETLFGSAIASLSPLLGEDHPEVLQAVESLALIYCRTGRTIQGLDMLEDRLIHVRNRLGADHETTLVALNNLAFIYGNIGQPEKAQPLLREAVEGFRMRLGAAHPETLTAMNNLAMNLAKTGAADEGLLLYAEVLETLDKANFQHPYANMILPNAILAFENAQQVNQADRWRTRWLDILSGVLINASATDAEALETFGRRLMAREDFQGAEESLRVCLSIRQEVQPDHWSTSNAQSVLGATRLKQAVLLGEAAEKFRLLGEAELLLVQGYEGLKQREASIPPQAAIYISESLDRLIELYTLLGKPEESEKYRELRGQYPEGTNP